MITVKIQADQDTASGEGYYRQGRYDLALQFFTNALSQFTSVDDGAGIVRSYTSIGKCYIALGSLDQAEGILLRAREKARGESPSLLFDASITLGELYLARGRPQEALSILQEAARATPGSRDPARAALLNHDLGTAEKNLGNSAKALEYFALSLNTNLAGKLFAEAAADYYMIASVHSRDGRYDEALRNAALALAYDKQVENSPGIAKDLSPWASSPRRRVTTRPRSTTSSGRTSSPRPSGSAEDMRKALAGLVAAADALGRTDGRGGVPQGAGRPGHVMKITARRTLARWFEAGRRIGFLLVLVAGSAALGLLISWPLWFFATSARQAYTITVLVLAGAGVVFLVVRSASRSRGATRDPGAAAEDGAFGAPDAADGARRVRRRLPCRGPPGPRPVGRRSGGPGGLGAPPVGARTGSRRGKEAKSAPGSCRKWE